MTKSYSEKLRDPRWQRKRLEVMNRDEFKCTKCGNGAVTLNVHHKKYRNGLNPWDYDLTELLTLCEVCHGKEHGIDNNSEKVVSDTFPEPTRFAYDFIPEVALLSEKLNKIRESLKQVESCGYPMDDISDAIMVDLLDESTILVKERLSLIKNYKN